MAAFRELCLFRALNASSCYYRPHAACPRKLSCVYKQRRRYLSSKSKSSEESDIQSSELEPLTTLEVIGYTQEGIEITALADSANQSDTHRAEPDIIKPRSQVARSKNVVFERLSPKPSTSNLQFTIGKQTISLERAEKAYRKDEPEMLTQQTSPRRSRNIERPKQATEIHQYLTNHHNLYKKHVELFSNTLPSIIGTSLNEVKESVQELRAAGFHDNEVDSILPIIPGVLDVNFENLYEIYSTLLEFLHSQHWVVGLLRKYPFIMTLDPGQVKETLAVYADLGVKVHDMVTLLNDNPLVFFVPLNDRTVRRVREAMAAGLDSKWLSRSLMYNLKYRPSLAELGPEAASLTVLLREYSVDVNDVLVKYPDLYSHSADQLYGIIATLSGAPLFLNKDDIQRLISSIPEVLLKLDNTEWLRGHLELLSEIYTSPVLRNILFSVKYLLDYRCDAVGKLRTLAAAGFDKQQTIRLLNNSAAVLVHDHLQEKIQLLLAIPGVSLEQLSTSARSYLQHSLPSLTARLKFAEQHKSKLLSGEKLDKLLATTDEQFAKQCGQSVSSYSKHAESFGYSLYDKVLKTRKTSKAPKKSENTPEATKNVRVSFIFAKTSLDEIFSTHSQTRPEFNERLCFNEVSQSTEGIEEELRIPKEFQDAYLITDSFENMEEPKLESLDVFDGCIVNREMEELLQELRASSFTKDRGMVDSQANKNWELLEEYFLDYDYLEDDVTELNTTQFS